MDQAQSAAGTGEAEQTTPTQPSALAKAEPSVEPEKLTPLQEAVRKELGIEVPKSEEPPKEEPKEEEPGEEPEPGPEEEQPAEEPPAAAEAEAEAETEEHEEAEVPENWPRTAKARVAEEARKRRERTKERDELAATVQTLQAQLQQATTAQLQPTKTLSEVVDRQSLAAAEAHWKEIRRFARTNPDGAYDVLIGKDANGNEQRKDYTREEIIQMGLDADEAFEALPARRAFIAESEANTEIAKKVYPDLFKDTKAGREAAGAVQRAPWILQSPEWALDIGDWWTGRSQRLAKQGKNGGKTLSPGAQAILEAPKITRAPGVIKSRSAASGPVRGGGGERVDEKRASEEFYAAGGTSEALEEKIKRKLEASQGGRTGGKQAALV